MRCTRIGALDSVCPLYLSFFENKCTLLSLRDKFSRNQGTKIGGWIILLLMG